MILFNPTEFLILAKTLINDNIYNNESCFRTCISRAYYAAFLTCREFLKNSHGLSFSQSAEVHKEVISSLRRRTVVDTLKGRSNSSKYIVADLLDKLRKEGRNRADYDLNVTITKNDALKWIQMAEDIISRIP